MLVLLFLKIRYPIILFSKTLLLKRVYDMKKREEMHVVLAIICFEIRHPHIFEIRGRNIRRACGSCPSHPLHILLFLAHT